ncbi:MAG: hypothetical protein QM496_13325 [Verrucomicrobiota bacterium]
MNRYSFLPILLALIVFIPNPAFSADSKKDTLNVLFIGNSYTTRHKLSQVVKAMAEAGQPGLTMNVTTIIYGGRTLADHWRLGSQNYLRLSALTAEEEQATIDSLEETIADNPKDNHAKSALNRHRGLLRTLDQPHKKWDIVVLQSYRDDIGKSPTLYAQYAPKFVEIIKNQGARAILYETSPTTQNAKPLKTAPDPTVTLKKEKAIAALADRIGADVVPMALVALRCQTERPDRTLRFINDAHLNHTMAYLTACTFYATLFKQSPEGLPIKSITDIRYFENPPKTFDKSKDRDGQPIKRIFSDKDAAQLQKIAWDAYNEFQQMRRK